jgi:hypothetical protein
LKGKNPRVECSGTNVPWALSDYRVSAGKISDFNVSECSPGFLKRFLKIRDFLIFREFLSGDI